MQTAARPAPAFGGEGLSFRRAGAEDVPALVELRLDFMRIVKDGGLPDEDDWRAELSELFGRELARGSLVCWICLDGAALVAASGLAFGRPDTEDDAAEGLILNMYTKPEYRRRGLASTLLRHSLEEGRSRGLTRFRLQPTEDGRALYESFGFRSDGEEMLLDLG